jgi:RNA polymerase sigma-70 factor, ECF subfamily
MPTRMEDRARTGTVAELIAQCIAGEDAAKARLIGEYSGVVRTAIARKLAQYDAATPLRADVEDLCNDVFERILRDDCRALQTLRNPDSIHFWLVTMAGRRAVSHLRRDTTRARYVKTQQREQKMVSPPAPDELAIRAEEANRVRGQLEKLPASDRLMLELYYLRGLRYSEIAEMTGRTIGVVSSQIHRAKAKLRKLMNAINLQEDSLYSTEIVPPGKVREDEHE